MHWQSRVRHRCQRDWSSFKGMLFFKGSSCSCATVIRISIRPSALVAGDLGFGHEAKLTIAETILSRIWFHRLYSFIQVVCLGGLGQETGVRDEIKLTLQASSDGAKSGYRRNHFNSAPEG